MQRQGTIYMECFYYYYYTTTTIIIIIIIIIIIKLESIQRRVLRTVFLDLSYKESLARSNLPALHDHRETLSRRFLFTCCLQSTTPCGNRLLSVQRVRVHNLRRQSHVPPIRLKHAFYPYELFWAVCVPSLLYWFPTLLSLVLGCRHVKRGTWHLTRETWNWVS